MLGICLTADAGAVGVAHGHQESLGMAQLQVAANGATRPVELVVARTRAIAESTVKARPLVVAVRGDRQRDLFFPWAFVVAERPRIP